MKRLEWNQEKNEQLKKERDISFEEVVLAIEKGHLLDVLENPNQEKYKNQKMLVLKIHNYVWLVPFIENDDEIFLKTIIPSRKATKTYLRGGEKND